MKKFECFICGADEDEEELFQVIVGESSGCVFRKVCITCVDKHPWRKCSECGAYSSSGFDLEGDEFCIHCADPDAIQRLESRQRRDDDAHAARKDRDLGDD